MKLLYITIAILLKMNFGVAHAGVVNDPLRDHYQWISKSDFEPQDDSPDFHFAPQTQVYYFEANFTGSHRHSVFITDEGEYLGAHGMYAWSVYCPVGSKGYQLVTDDGRFITAGLGGPVYIGYISQIKRYGVIIGTKDSVAAYYLKNGAIRSKALDLERGHADSRHYPAYFKEKPLDYHIATYTLAQLAKKYGSLKADASVAPAYK